MKLAKNYIVLVSLLSSIIGLILIYVAAVSMEPTKISVSEITPELIGKTVSITGSIIYKSKHEAGHLFLTISDDDEKIQIPLFAGLMKNLGEFGITSEDFEIGDKISVTGMVEEFNNQLQVQPRKADDVKILVSE